MAEKYLTVEEVAALLSITNAEVIAATTSGQLRGYKDGAAWKFRQEDVEKFITARREEANRVEDDDFGYGDYDIDDEAGNAGSSDINNTLDEDVPLLAEESGVALTDYAGDDGDLVLGEDDGVLGGSGTGSSLTLSEESGISLMSATDSGISLEDDASGEVLELGEDDLSMGSSLLSGSLAASLSGTGEENFKLTTAEDDTDVADDDDSGSQVIMIDNDSLMGEEFDELNVSENAGEGLDDSSSQPLVPEVLMPVMDPGLTQAALPERPYSVLSIVGLVFCFLFLALTLLFTVDLIRNMWSWNQLTPASSALMDWVVETFVK